MISWYEESGYEGSRDRRGVGIDGVENERNGLVTKPYSATSVEDGDGEQSTVSGASVGKEMSEAESIVHSGDGYLRDTDFDYMGQWAQMPIADRR